MYPGLIIFLGVPNPSRMVRGAPEEYITNSEHTNPMVGYHGPHNVPHNIMASLVVPRSLKKYQQSSSFVIGNLYAPNVHHWSTVLCRMSRDCLWWHMWTYHNLSPAPLYNFFWLVVDLPLWKIWKSNGIPNIWKKSCSKPQTSCSKCISIWSSVSALLISASSLRGLNMMWFHARLAQQAKAGWIADNFGKEQELRLDVSHSSAF